MIEADYIIVGCGFFGAVLAERVANDFGRSVLIIERRPHIGGNCFSEKCPDTGIEFHSYGTHIFHTSSDEVWNYIRQFSDFNNYHHQVLTTYKGRVYPMPINLETVNLFYQEQLRPFQLEGFMRQELAKESYPQPKNLEEKAINLVGRPLYEAFIKGYTEKQWGRKATKLPLNIIQRLPVRSNYDRTYFKSARYQGIPLNGYHELFKQLTSSRKIRIMLDCDYLCNRKEFKANYKTIYTGPIDQYYNFRYGALEWRSVRFEKEIVPVEDYQGTAVMNYAEASVPYTRIHEPRHLHPERQYENRSVVLYEYSGNDYRYPYYPIMTHRNQEIFKKYKQMAMALDNDLIIGGRLGNYCYVDMDQVIQMALNCYKRQIRGEES